MKTIIFTITIFLTALFAEPFVQTGYAEGTATYELFKKDGPKVNKRSAKRFKTHKGLKRRKNTCLKRLGCKPKLRNQKKSNCGFH